MIELTEEQKRDLLAALAPLDADYDPDEQMIREPFHSPGYHTTLRAGTVHPTRSALTYAVALLDTGEAWRCQRACDILDRVIALQDQDPTSRTYGIWSWFLEEPLDKMSPPDWNWADFNGTQLLQVALDHRERLPHDLARRLDEATIHAARSIERRNVGPGYTNIALMGTYVTYVAAELYQLADLLAYARARLQRFYDYTLEQDGFTEFNSPTYTVVALNVLTRMRMHIRDSAAQPMIEALHDIGWRDVARHFHPPTAQWAGPHSRCYSTLLRPGTLAFIERACRGAVRFFPEGKRPVSIEDQRLDVRCPDRYIPFFVSLTAPREVVQVFIRGAAAQSSLVRGGSPLPVIGTTYLTPAYALGTTNRHHFWNQSRPLVAYWGTREAPQALQARVLHDGYDYASAQFFSMQSRGCLLAAINFATDFGDTHVSLDPVRDATIRARDMRVRFELFNISESWPLTAFVIGQTNTFDLGVAQLDLSIPYAAFGDWPIRTEVSRQGNHVYLDLILYEGEERQLDFRQMREAVILLALRLRERQEPAMASIDVHYEPKGKYLHARWALPDGETLAVQVLRHPATLQELHAIAPTRGA